MRFFRLSVTSCLKNALGAFHARHICRLLVAVLLTVPCVCNNSVARGDDLPAPLVAPPSVAAANTDFARSEIRTAFPVIAPEPTELPAGTRSIYEQALLGEEAPTLLLTVAGQAAAAQGTEGVIAPSSDASSLTDFESSATTCDLPPISCVNDAWCFLPRVGHDALAVANWNNLAILGVALGGSLAVRGTLDSTVRNWTAEHPDRWGEGSKIIGDLGVAQYQVPVILGAYAYTVYTQNYYQHDMMCSLISAYTLFGISTVTIKGIADTNRPSDTWNGGKYGFPS